MGLDTLEKYLENKANTLARQSIMEASRTLHKWLGEHDCWQRSISIGGQPYNLNEVYVKLIESAREVEKNNLMRKMQEDIGRNLMKLSNEIIEDAKNAKEKK